MLTVNGHTGEHNLRLVRALCSYNPSADSPNDNHEEELQLEEGDLITIIGGPDADGFYEVSCTIIVMIVCIRLCENFSMTQSTNL